MNVRGKVAVMIGVVVCGALVAGFVVPTGPVRTRPLQFGGLDGTHVGYQFSYREQLIGKVVGMPRSVKLFEVVNGERREIVEGKFRLVLTNDIPMIWFPRSSAAVYEHEVRLLRTRYLVVGGFPIPTGQSTEVWTTGVVTNAGKMTKDQGLMTK